MDDSQDDQSPLTTDLASIRKALKEIKGTIAELQAWRGGMEKRDNPADVPASDWPGRFRGRCWNCGELGHLRRHCPTPAQDRRNQGPYNDSSSPTDQTSKKTSVNLDPAGMYLPVGIYSKIVPFLIDSGSSITLVSKETFENLSEEIKQTRKKGKKTLWLADGSQIENKGTLRLDMEVGGAVLEHEVHIADIGSDAILGLDFLMNHHCFLDWHNGVIKLNGKDVTLQSKKDQAGIFRVKVTETVIVPSGHELVVGTQLVRRGQGIHPVDWSGTQQAILTPLLSFMERHDISKMYRCEPCNLTFNRRSNYRRHRNTSCPSSGNVRAENCRFCGSAFYRREIRIRHERFCRGISPAGERHPTEPAHHRSHPTEATGRSTTTRPRDDPVIEVSVDSSEDLAMEAAGRADVAIQATERRGQADVETQTGHRHSLETLTLNGGDVITIRGRRYIVGEATRITVESAIEDPSTSAQTEETHVLDFHERWNVETTQLGFDTTGHPLSRTRVTHTFECPVRSLRTYGGPLNQFFVPPAYSDSCAYGGIIPPGAPPPPRFPPGDQQAYQTFFEEETRRHAQGW
ncbi:Retroviral-like aspartic protease 1 [Holothuria leucospilota]|uniref:Retroviral-like aspartic protease 1 n=1 Tax=Holothuria leucospilota TaxID=206669 RepID=A0A9Q0YJ01_HOLLE|nr:Retroviral-like aspartic protease 1 [Holothuria leucospilota]